jgi:hypothetical protein
MTEQREPMPPRAGAESSPAPIKRKGWRSRPCLRCRRVFRGGGPAERICGFCKETDSWRNAVAASKGFIEW